jgi:mRNA interferase MazF
LRPAVVLAETSYGCTVCFITTQTERQELTDIRLSPNQSNNLKKASFIRTNKIATLDKILAKGLLGKLSTEELVMLNATQNSFAATIVKIPHAIPPILFPIAAICRKAGIE